MKYTSVTMIDEQSQRANCCSDTKRKESRVRFASQSWLTPTQANHKPYDRHGPYRSGLSYRRQSRSSPSPNGNERTPKHQVLAIASIKCWQLQATSSCSIINDNGLDICSGLVIGLTSITRDESALCGQQCHSNGATRIH